MRKDYLVDSHHGDDSEIAFVERYWTEIWQNSKGIDTLVDKVRRSDEYRVIRRFMDHLPKGARILDGGCGLGNWSLFFARQGYDVVGMDISRATIALLQEKFPDVTFATGDIRAMDLAADSVDAYLSWGVFEHFESGVTPCIDEAMRVLKPGGYLMISVPFDNIRQSLRANLAGYKSLGTTPEDLRFYQWRFTRKELATELARCGFQVEEIRPIHKRQGVLRSLNLEFGLPYQWLLTRAMSAAIAPFVPGALVAHMILAVARKPVADPQA